MDADRIASSEDLSGPYLVKTQDRAQSSDVSQMEQFLAAGDKGDTTATAPTPQPPNPADPGRTLPPPKPLRRETADSIGRFQVPGAEERRASVMRNAAEIPGAAVAGVESAVTNALGWAINPLANWLNENVADLSYKRADPQTPTGDIVKGATEFITGFVPAMKGFRALGMTGTIAAPLAAGALASFAVQDPSKGRLSDLWKKAGLPNNILTDYLSSKPDDTETESRFKNALEGTGLGVLTEGVLLGARVLRSAMNIRGAKQTETAYLKDKYGEIDDATYSKIAGDPSKPSVTLAVSKPPEAPAKIAKGAKDTEALNPEDLIGPNANQELVNAADKVSSGGKLTAAEAQKFPQLVDLQKAKEIQATPTLVPNTDVGGKQVYINFGRFDEPEEIQKAIGKMADHAAGSIEEAQRGVITHEETQKLADELGMTVTDLLARKQGTPFNAEQAVAARQLWAASGERLVELAKTAAGPNAGPLDQFAFRKAMAVHAAIQSEIIGARTETARALSSWNINVKGGIERARAIDQIMGAMGGPEASGEMARRIAILAETGADPAAIAKFAKAGAGASTVDAVREAWINGLLSNPKTHVVNVFSNSLVAFGAVLERVAAGAIRSISGGEGVEMGEAAAMTFGMVNSVREAFRMAAKAVKTGETSWTFNKMDLPAQHAITPEAFGMSQDTVLGKFVDFIGTAARVPTRLLGAEDEFFKTIGYRAELHAQAYRTARQEGLSGYDFGKRIAEIVQNPPEHIMINSADAALYQTFTNETGAFGQAIMKAREGMPGLTLVLPFVRTPVNIFRYAMERTPFAPLVSQWRADVAAGGARADLALARMSTGTMVMLQAMDLADKGFITGPGFRGGKDTTVAEAEERQGMIPYAAKVGDRWYSYNRADPFGMTIGFAASIAEAVKKGELDHDQVDEWQEVVAMSIAAISNVAINKTYLQGFAQFMEVLTDPKRYSQQYVDNLFASFLPATALMSAIKNVGDPVAREVNNPLDAVQARIATLSKNLTPRRDLWGKEQTPGQSGLGKAFDFVTPIASKEEQPSPIDKEMVRMNAGIQRIGKQTPFDGVQANMRFYPHAYDDYVRLSGNDLKSPAHGGLGAKDYLNSVVSGAHPVSAAYNIMSDESRRAFIDSTIQDYRKEAQRQILGDPKHSAFAAEIAQLKTLHQNARMPIL